MWIKTGQHLRLGVVTVVLLLAACGGGDQTTLEEPASTTIIPVETEPLVADTATTPSSIIEVTLSEYGIEMPENLPPGSTTFEIRNSGTKDHAFEIEGPGMERETRRLEGGGTTTLKANLEPGIYRIYCPVENHAQQGMELQLVVK